MGGKGSGVRNMELRAEVRLLLAKKPPLTFAQIGESVGVSRQRVHQLAKGFGDTGRAGK